MATNGWTMRLDGFFAQAIPGDRILRLRGGNLAEWPAQPDNASVNKKSGIRRMVANPTKKCVR
jgi:hypothetical protein